jgi:hypothetical protein
MLQPGTSNANRRFLPREADFMPDEPRRDQTCVECSASGGERLGAGATQRLPTG